MKYHEARSLSGVGRLPPAAVSGYLCGLFVRIPAADQFQPELKSLSALVSVPHKHERRSRSDLDGTLRLDCQLC